MDQEVLDRVPAHARPGLLAIAASQPNYGVLARVPADVVLQRIADGDLPTQIAKELGVSLSAISMRFQGDPRYKQARELGTEVLLDVGLESIKEAGDDVNIARAREVWLRRLEWRAERDFPHRWGKTVETIDSTGDLGDRLRRARERVIEQDPDKIEDVQAQQVSDKSSK